MLAQHALKGQLSASLYVLLTVFDNRAHGEVQGGKNVPILAVTMYGAAKCIAELYPNRLIAPFEQQKLE